MQSARQMPFRPVRRLWGEFRMTTRKPRISHAPHFALILLRKERGFVPLAAAKKLLRNSLLTEFKKTDEAGKLSRFVGAVLRLGTISRTWRIESPRGSA